ncbi:hypothetical protein D8I24_3071 (plasmid) [Cupriavidus necator H850]|jgi:hypothetical protein|uniref:lipase family protein n=1 Tax=Cupriavidus TaxID=106589 RepID=UPI00129EBF53|nr:MULTISPECIES: lipase family protein [Cupriavidus]KAI3603248.1 hypothetical protein D8I24_3071 [Cupriavidus necator H850]QUN32092.1 triacylglycerol lipase [Cupriavidus sp. KK10]
MKVCKAKCDDFNVGAASGTADLARAASSGHRKGWRGCRAAFLMVALSIGVVTASSAQIIPQDYFYVPPNPLPPGKPGDVIRTRTITAPLFPNALIQQIMYLSSTASGKPVAVTGVVATPLLRAAGQPLVVMTPGTRGTGDQCAPSKQFGVTSASPDGLDYESGTTQQLLARGISVVLTDYEGQGTPGLPSYLVGRSEGYNGLDALRAAQRLPGAGVPAGAPVGVVGYSQGGQAAGWVAELQPTYAPELDFRGALVGGVPTDMLVEVNHLNGNPTAGAGFGLAALSGLDHAFPELNLDGRLTDVGRQVMQDVRTSCFDKYLTAYGTTSAADVTQPNVLADSQWQQRFNASLLGTKVPGAPAFIFHGTADQVVPFALGQLLFSSWCSRGADVTFKGLIGLEHGTGNFAGPPDGIDWLAQRLAGVAAAHGCFDVTLP